MAHARAKNISPLQMRRVVKFAVHHDLWCGNCFMVGRWRINGARTGEKYFARTSMVRRRVAGATIWGVAMFDGWVTGHRWRTDGRKIFRPYTCGAWLHWAGATNGCGDECQWDIDGVGAIGNYFARAWAGWI